MPLLLVGVGHVFRIGEALQSLIVQEGPEIVALELDPRRYQGLEMRERGQPAPDPSATGAPLMYRALAKFQEGVAQTYGVEVGSEMVAAIRGARAVGAKLALVDQPAEVLVQRLWKEMRLREKLRMLWSGLTARFRLRGSQGVEDEIGRYEANPAAYLGEVGRQYPTVKRILIDERNAFMARNLRHLAQDQRVLAVIGDGHIEGLLHLLGDLEPRTVRLSQLRAYAEAAPDVKWQWAPGGDTVRFSFEQTSPEGTLRRP